jgi:phosphatidylglycerol:prolipoprotein diacylglycerol transferase
MWAYTCIMLLAVVAAFVLSRQTQRNLGLAATERLGIGVGAFCGSMIGAKLPFLFSDWQSFLSGAAWFSDGKTILLGMAGGYLGVETAKWCLGVRTRTGDSFSVPVAVAIAIGRIGCFVGGCCYGTPTTLPWGVVFRQIDGQPRHPVQLYETAFHAVAAGIMAVALRRQLCRGQLIKIYIIAYAGWRFLTEFIRPEVRFSAGLTLYQWASLMLIAGFGWLWYRDTRGISQTSP